MWTCGQESIVAQTNRGKNNFHTHRERVPGAIGPVETMMDTAEPPPHRGVKEEMWQAIPGTGAAGSDEQD